MVAVATAAPQEVSVCFVVCLSRLEVAVLVVVVVVVVLVVFLSIAIILPPHRQTN